MNGVKKKVKINFVDFWQSYNKSNNMFVNSIKKKFDVEISEKPDYLFYSAMGGDHLNYDCIRIFYTGENLRPDFNVCDYAIGFDWITFEDRYIRWPLYRNSISYSQLINKRDGAQILSEKKNFCNYIYSNNSASPFRERFFRRLSQHKLIDSMGPHLNNKSFPDLSQRYASDWAKSKIEVIRPYKFTIAFENSATSGYTTEKIIHAMVAETIPIYWGNPHIDREFNPDSFIWVRDETDFEPAIEQIIKLDENDSKWIEMMNKKWIFNDYLEKTLVSDKFDHFIFNIFDQDIEKARRRSNYVWEKRHEKRLKVGFSTK